MIICRSMSSYVVFGKMSSEVTTSCFCNNSKTAGFCNPNINRKCFLLHAGKMDVQDFTTYIFTIQVMRVKRLHWICNYPETICDAFVYVSFLWPFNTLFRLTHTFETSKPVLTGTNDRIDTRNTSPHRANWWSSSCRKKASELLKNVKISNGISWGCYCSS